MARTTTADILFGQRVRSYRQATGVTQADLAATIGIRQQTISWIENGERPAIVSEALAIAAALRVEIADLMGRGSAHTESTPCARCTKIAGTLAAALVSLGVDGMPADE